MSVMNHDEERFFRLGLVLAGGGSRIRRLVADAPGGEPLFASVADRGAPRVLLDTATKLARAEAQTVVDRITIAGWRWLIPGDGQYPGLLAATSDPPLGLFVRGRLENRPTVAIVGSRKATPYGLQVARLLGEELGNAGVVMVSGMARGADEAAHRGALDAGGPNWAVWGTGPDRIYPPEHGELAEEIATTGALITEYPPGTPPRRHHFPERNRILSGLALAVVVVEAAARSGALITARLAMEEGREVLAVPGNIFSELSVGPNTLLRVGARPLLTLRDLFEAIGCESPTETKSSPEKGLLRFIGAGEALTADEIAARAKIAVGEVLGELLALELAGEISRRPDGQYSRKRVPRDGNPEETGFAG
jgi:DNA processing protein